MNVTYKTSLKYINQFIINKINILVNNIKITSIDYVYLKNTPLKRIKVDYDVNTLFTDGNKLANVIERHAIKKMPWEIIEETSRIFVINMHILFQESYGYQPIHRVLKMMNKGFKIY